MSVSENHQMICPECLEDNDLSVTFTGVCNLTPGGSEDCGDHEWDDESACSCTCGWNGWVRDAQIAYKVYEAVREQHVAENE